MHEEERLPDQPLVSIIIPVFNKVGFVESTLKSALNQSYSPIEVLVVDDGSDDGTSELLTILNDGSFELIRQNNLGVECARNLGWTKSSGQLVVFLDADDIMMQNRIAAQVVEFESDDNLVLLGTRAKLIDSRGQRVGALIPPLQNDSLQLTLLFKNPFVLSSVMIRRSSIDGLPFVEGLEPNSAEDYRLWWRIARTGTIRNLSTQLTSYRLLKSSRSHSAMTSPAADAHKLSSSQILQILQDTNIGVSEVNDLVQCLNDWSVIFNLEGRFFSARPVVLYLRILHRQGIRITSISRECKKVILGHLLKIIIAQIVRLAPRSMRCRLLLIISRLRFIE